MWIRAARRRSRADARSAKPLGAALRGLVFAAAVAGGVAAARPALADPWLFVSDIHFDPTSDDDPAPASYGFDTNLALLESSLAEMQRVDPRPPVIVIAGDFLAHHFHYADADATMKRLARRFDRAFPHAQFVIALGNEDSGCGNYEVTGRAPFLRTVAAAWEPLVNRRGSAPAFVRTFGQDGFYTAALPAPHLRAIVIDDVFWSPRYRAACGGASAGDGTMRELRAALIERPRDATWVVAHIPPGVDAFSTAHLMRQLIIVPFLAPARRDALLEAIADPRAHVTAMLAAHTHKFAYRVVRRPGGPAVPILLIPSISPIFHNAPSFLTVDVGADGTITSAADHAFIDGRWAAIGGTRTLRLARVSGSALLDLQDRLARDPALRSEFARLYSGGGPAEIDAGTWRAYWCAATAFSTPSFAACIGTSPGIGIVTRSGVVILGGGVGLAALAAGLLVWRRRSRGGAAAGATSSAP